MAEQATEQETEETTVWQYQVRNKNGDVISEWTTAAEGDFKWPKVAKDQTRWQKTGKKWQQIK